MWLIVCGLALMAVTVLLVWRATSRWWHPIAIVALGVLLVPLVAQGPTGDVSRYLPHDVFTGKDDVAAASMVATLMAAIALAAAAFWLVGAVVARLRGK